MKKTSSPPSPEPSAPHERDATPEEMRALGHSMRWRILRMTLDRAMTNKEIADRLGRDPGTVLHHVKVLVEHGFLAAVPERRGRHGARELPYRSTGKTWRIRLKQDLGNVGPIIDAAREEIVEAGEDSLISTLRLGVRLKEEDLAELKRRIVELGDHFEPRDDPDGEPVAILAVVHRRRP